MSVFYLEQTQFDWLPSSQQKTLKIESILLAGLFYALATWLSFFVFIWWADRLSSEDIYDVVAFGLISGLGFVLGSGLAFGSYAVLYEIIKAKTEKLQLKSSKLTLGLIVGLCSGLILMLIKELGDMLSFLKIGFDLPFFLIFGLIFGFVFGPFAIPYAIKKARAEKLQLNSSKMIYGLISGLTTFLVIGLSSTFLYGMTSWLSNGLIYGFITILFFGLVIGLETKELNVREYPNEGTHLAAKNAVFVGLSSWLIILLGSGLILGQIDGLKFGLYFGLIIGLVIGLVFGGYECIQHYLLRIAFYRHNLAPLSYVDFLDYAADRIFLRKIGGGYVFIHRMILEYFASLEPD